MPELHRTPSRRHAQPLDGHRQLPGQTHHDRLWLRRRRRTTRAARGPSLADLRSLRAPSRSSDSHQRRTGPQWRRPGGYRRSGVPLSRPVLRWVRARVPRICLRPTHRLWGRFPLRSRHRLDECQHRMESVPHAHRPAERTLPWSPATASTPAQPIKRTTTTMAPRSPARFIDEFTEVAGHEEEPLKGLQWVEELVDPVVLHSAQDGGFDAGCEAATLASTSGRKSRLTPDAYVYTRSSQDWTIRRLYRPAEAVAVLRRPGRRWRTGRLSQRTGDTDSAGRFATQGVEVLPGNGRSVSFVFASQQLTEIREANGLLSSTLGYPTVRPATDHSRLPAMMTMATRPCVRDFGLRCGHMMTNGSSPRPMRWAETRWLCGSSTSPTPRTVTDENGAFVAKTVYYYDGAAFIGVQGQILNRAPCSAAGIEYIDATHTIQATRTRYDAFGNIEESARPGRQCSSGHVGSGLPHLSRHRDDGRGRRIRQFGDCRGL